MCAKVAIVYNQPVPSRYWATGEEKAVLGVLDAVEAVGCALVVPGYQTSRVPLLPPMSRARDTLLILEADLVFNLFEGFAGEPETEAALAGLLSETGLAYTGCPPAALSLSLDKAKAKAILDAGGVDTPRFQTLTPATLAGFSLDFPCIVKPCGEDASHGISAESVVSDAAALARQVARVSDLFGGAALVEEFVDGREFNCTVLGNDEPVVLPVSEIVYDLPAGVPRILTFAAKWQEASVDYEATKAVCPAPIDAGLRERIAGAALAAFKLLGCRGYARVDFRADAQGNPKVLEVNANPDISPGAGAARQARAAGMTYSQFVQEIVRLGLERA